MSKWPKNLVLVRHGESEYNKERNAVSSGKLNDYSERMKHTRNADIDLTALGQKQARATGVLLKKRFQKFDAVFVSPFMRARQTAAGILKAWSGPAPKTVIEDRVREKEFGIFHAITSEDIQKLYPEWHHLKKMEGKYYYRPPGGESYPDVTLRLQSFLGTLVRDYRDRNVLIVSHSAVMLAFHKLMARLTEAQVLRLDRENEIKNCGVIAYEFDSKAGARGKMVPVWFNKKAY